MDSLPKALQALASYKQFMLYKKVPSPDRPGKTDKFPCNIGGNVVSAHESQYWLDVDAAITAAKLFGEPYGVAYTFTEDDPFFFIDIDDCLSDDGTTWINDANELMNALPGVAIEISQSGSGLHLIGTGRVGEHGCESKTVDAALYTKRRFVALTGDGAMGDAGLDLTPQLSALVAQHFPVLMATTGIDWTDQPVEQWNGYTDDDELIKRACAATSAAAAFSGKANFVDLWENNVELLTECYPDDAGLGVLDDSKVDMALAQHLCFWTGNNHERVQQLMWKSALVREKWTKHKSFLYRTITRAVSLQKTVYTAGVKAPVDNSLAEQYGAPVFKGSVKQVEWANNVRAQKLLDCQGDEEVIQRLCSARLSKPSFWIDHQHSTVEQIIEAITPVETASAPMGNMTKAEILSGFQFLGVTQQMEHFKGCVYVQNIHKIFTPSGAVLKTEQFNATYGGYVFQLDSDAGGKTTKKAWEAFTESQAIRYPKAALSCFRPDQPSGSLVEHEGHMLVNTYVPINTRSIPGDPEPFLEHLRLVLPDEHDQGLLLAYMAACIQQKGTKFQWAPLLQGVEGNGKTLFTRCVAFAIGDRYTHMPPAHDISEKFNAWLFDMMFIGVEDIYVPDHKREIIEVLKPMITSDRLAKRDMGVGQIMHHICCNFIFNSNHRNAVAKTRNDRRFSVFFTAQQNEEDLRRDGMDDDYFKRLYGWLKADGYAIVNDYLTNYPIPKSFNPTGRAPDTSTTNEAVAASLGIIEQELIEAIEEGRPGFANGWVSSIAFGRLLDEMRKSWAIPRNRRKEILQSMGYEWHPGLKDGRITTMILSEQGKPRLFIKKGHISANLKTMEEIVKAYQVAQGDLSVGINNPANAFENNNQS